MNDVDVDTRPIGGYLELARKGEHLCLRATNVPALSRVRQSDTRVAFGCCNGFVGGDFHTLTSTRVHFSPKLPP